MISTTNRRSSRAAAVKAIDVLVVISCVVVCLVVIPPALRKLEARSSRLGCINNIKEIGTGFRLWSNDNSMEFPMRTSKEIGGSLEFTNAGETYRHFLVASGEITSAATLVCPNDRQRVRAKDFSADPGQFNNKNVSYFIGLDAQGVLSEGLLVGDRSLEGSSLTTPITTLDATSVRNLSWTRHPHRWKGNVGFANGSAQELSSSGFRQAISDFAQVAREITNASQRIMLP